MSVVLCCAVCQASAARYRCPRCKARYCSVSCCQKHKDACTDAPAPDANTAVTAEPALSDSNVYTDGAPHLLSDEQKRKLDSDESVRTFLKSKRLRDALSDIDQSKDRQKCLRIARRNPEFEEFVNEVLRAIE